MNIFVLDNDPVIAATMHVDRHVVKMILETAQLLSTAVKTFNPSADGLYKVSHVNHPCAKWTRTTKTNFQWLAILGMQLNDEYYYRYGKEHKSYEVILSAYKNYEHLIPDGDLTSFVQAMPDEYKVPGNAVQAYRNYYRGAKQHLLVYTKRDPPEWIKDLAKHKILK